MRGRDKLNKYRILISFSVFLASILPKNVLLYCYRNFDMIRGNIGIFLRFVIVKNVAASCGENVSIHKACHVYNLDQIHFGDNISIHSLCYIDGFGGLVIGSDTSIAHGVSIMSSTHNYSNYGINIKDQGVIKKFTEIGNNVWIGAKAMIIGGIKIEDRTIIGASAVVTKNVMSNTIVAGNPAKTIKSF